jgi:hypothetical protein
VGNGASYTYGSKPHAVTAVGSTSYAYDDNGNMTTRGTQTITWDVENRPVSVSYNGTASTFIYDGDGNRGKKTEGGETILYINRYYEKNLTSGKAGSHEEGHRPAIHTPGPPLRYGAGDIR